MKNGKKLLLLLLVLVVLVGATAIVGTISKNAADQEDETQTVFSLDPENVTNLGWDYSEKVSFTAGEDGWVCDQDGAFPVDETYLDKMLEVLTDVESTKTIENPENLDQYGLEIPVCVITGGGWPEPHPFHWAGNRRGRPAVLLQRRWKRLSGGQRHYRKFSIWPV